MPFGTTTSPYTGTQFTSETNPRLGKKKGTKNFATLIREMVEDPEYKIKLNNGKWLKKPGKAIVQAMTIKATQGDVQAATWLSKFGYGEKQDITTNGESLGSGEVVSLQLSGDFAKYLLEKTRVSPVIEGVVVNTTDTVADEANPQDTSS